MPVPAMFGTLGGPEILLILVLALIVFGPRKLPEIGKSMGRMMAEFRKASNEFRRTLEEEVETEKLKEATPPPPASEPPPVAEPPGTVEPAPTAEPAPADEPAAALAPGPVGDTVPRADQG